MKKIMLSLLLLLLCIVLRPMTLLAADMGKNKTGAAILETQLDNLPLKDVDQILRDNDAGIAKGLSFQELVMKAISGQLDLSPQGIIKAIGKVFFGELQALLSLIRNMLLISILSAFIHNLSLSLKHKEVSELGFYISYLVMIILLISSFHICVEVMHGMVNILCGVMQAALPAMLTLLAISGNPGSAYVFHPVLIFVVNVLSAFVRDYIVPVIIFAAMLQLVNSISEQEPLQKMAELMKDGISWILKGVAVLFIGIVSLQGISTPIVNNAVTKSAKAAIGVVPVVGQALSGAVDTVLFWSSAAKSGVMVAVVVVLLLVCAVPVLKLAAFVVVFKVTAALIQPISDPRLVKAVDSLGSFMGVLLGVCVTVAVLFIFMTMVMLSL